VINEAQRERAAARAELERAPVPNLLTDAEVYAMIDSLGDVGAALSDAKRESLANLYTGINLQVLYEPTEKVADVSVRLGRRVNSAGVRGGTRASVGGTRAQAGVHGGSVARRSAGVDQRVCGSLGKSRNSATLAGGRSKPVAVCAARTTSPNATAPTSGLWSCARVGPTSAIEHLLVEAA